MNKNLLSYLKNTIFKPLQFIVFISLSFIFFYQHIKVHSTSYFFLFILSIVFSFISFLDLIFIYRKIKPILEDLKNISNNSYKFYFKEFDLANKSISANTINKILSKKENFYLKNKNTIDLILHDLKFPLFHLKKTMSPENKLFIDHIEKLIEQITYYQEEYLRIDIPSLFTDIKKIYKNYMNINIHIDTLNLFTKNNYFFLKRSIINLFENFLRRDQINIDVHIFQKNNIIEIIITSKKNSSYSKEIIEDFYKSKKMAFQEIQNFFEKNKEKIYFFDEKDTFSYVMEINRTFPLNNFSSYLLSKNKNQIYIPEFNNLYKLTFPSADFYLLDNDFIFTGLLKNYCNQNNISLEVLESFLDLQNIPTMGNLFLDLHITNEHSSLDIAEKLFLDKKINIYLLTGDKEYSDLPYFIKGFFHKNDFASLNYYLKNIVNFQQSQQIH
jgi:hypothetical protein